MDREEHRFPFPERAAGVRRIRQELKLSQARLAHLAGISQPTLSAFELGDVDVSPATMVKLQEALSGAAAEAQIAALKAATDLGNPGGLRTMDCLRYAEPGSEEYKRNLAQYQRDSALTSPAYRVALLGRISELQGEVSRLRYYLAQAHEAEERVNQILRDAVTQEGAEILAKESPAEVPHE